MRHRIFGKKLGRNHNERQALLKSLTKSIFTHGAIETTQAKAKAVLPLVEKLSSKIITKDELTVKRELFKIFQDQTWVNNIVSEFKKVFGEQSSNFTKIQKVKYRYGDNSLIVKLSFVKPIKFLIKKEVEIKDPKKSKKGDKKTKVSKKSEKEVKKDKKVEAKKIKKETK